MKQLVLLSLFILGNVFFALSQERKTYTFEEGWKFTREDNVQFSIPDFPDKKWQSVNVPHDWAIYGPFSIHNDKQFVAIVQDGQKEAQSQSGRTGGLPFIGTGWYRLKFKAPEFRNGKRAILIFDGAMSRAKIYVNGRNAGEWPYGYNTFYLDVTNLLHKDGMENSLAVRLENEPESSRWYPGAGLYRNVHLLITDVVHIPVWGVHITTPIIKKNYAKVNIRTSVSFPQDTNINNIKVKNRIIDPFGKEIARGEKYLTAYDDSVISQDLIVTNPELWDCDHPSLYKAVTEVYENGLCKDSKTTVFGVRSIEIIPDKGFFLNGRHTIFKGVCLHHDLGPLGTAVNEAAIRRQIRILKDMGCNAIRTSHNMPAPELVKLCNEMGMMLMAESFDEWKAAKMKNGYNKFFDKWIEKDIVNEVRHYRNDPSIVFWCIGNEVSDQFKPGGSKICKFIQDIFHREDPTRPCTMGADGVEADLYNNFMAVLDVPGFNYRVPLIQKAYSLLPQRLAIGSETASTVSSRGIYKFPVQRKAMAQYPDNQSSSYDVERCSWSELPEDNFILYDHSLPYYMGEFVWTGFDYLGEPTPYYDNWPSHSSYFGIIDLAGIPKDRYYLYRSFWNQKAETLHILPHWNWQGREGKNTPVFVYTNYPTVELFINGKSHGKRTKDLSVQMDHTWSEDSLNALSRQRRYRLMWMDTKYEPGTVKAVAYDKNGKKVAETEIKTAGEPHHIELVPDRKNILSDGKDLSFVTVKVVDKDGNLCPTDNHLITYKVKGQGIYKAGANGDPTCLESFQLPQMHAFNGMMTVIIQSLKGKVGTITLEATGKGLKKTSLKLQSISQ